MLNIYTHISQGTINNLEIQVNFHNNLTIQKASMGKNI